MSWVSCEVAVLWFPMYHSFQEHQAPLSLPKPCLDQLRPQHKFVVPLNLWCLIRMLSVFACLLHCVGHSPSSKLVCEFSFSCTSVSGHLIMLFLVCTSLVLFTNVFLVLLSKRKHDFKKIPNFGHQNLVIFKIIQFVLLLPTWEPQENTFVNSSW